MSAPKTETADAVDGVDLDAIQASAERRVAELRERQQGLSLDALGDSKAATELVKLERDLADAEGQLARVGLARTERQRRETQARQQAEADRRQAALERARELQTERELQARRIDASAKAFAEAIVIYDSLCVEQD
ncbi:MAG: hypothetical protein M3065_01445 [Actinomycetota bacterium]|nr:hypothetical protein [Actinomycetota bacterium]